MIGTCLIIIVHLFLLRLQRVHGDVIVVYLGHVFRNDTVDNGLLLILLFYDTVDLLVRLVFIVDYLFVVLILDQFEEQVADLVESVG